MKYSKREILEIIRANHKQRLQVEIDFPTIEELNFELTIRNWIDDFELVEWKKLGKYYTTLFKIDYQEEELLTIMTPTRNKTIGNLCEYLSSKANKPVINPAKLLGKICEEAGIYRYLITQLSTENKKAKSIKPSSKVSDYMHEFASKLIEEVNLISPNILPVLKFEENDLRKQEWKLFLSSLLIVLISSIITNWFLAGIGVGFLIAGIFISWVGNKLPAKKFEFENIDTFRDLIKLIQKERAVASRNE